jgi:hypothetical protein
MTIGDTELGRLTKDHLQTHNQVAKHRAELEQFGDNLILLGNNLKAHPQDISVAEAKVMLKDDHTQDRTILWTALDIPTILHELEELHLATQREQDLAHRIREAGMGHIVEGISNRRAPTPDTLRRQS